MIVAYNTSHFTVCTPYLIGFNRITGSFQSIMIHLLPGHKTEHRAIKYHFLSVPRLTLPSRMSPAFAVVVLGLRDN